MNNFGEFLYELRKEKRMTQAELANALGVSNKAVSKWELGEAMPETSLLLPLSRIFDVTVDELLAGKRNDIKASEKNHEGIDEEIKEEAKESTQFNFKNHLFSQEREDEKKETIYDIISGIVCTAIFLIGTAAYLVLGLTKVLWHPYWVIFPCCAFLCGIVGIIFNLCDSEKRAEKFKQGENPYTGGICGIIILVCLSIYLPLGAFLNLWHPCWIIVVIGAFLCAFVGSIGIIGVYKNKKKNECKIEQ